MLDIADIPFTQVSDEEKAEYDGKPNESGTYQGYKPRSFWVTNRVEKFDSVLILFCTAH